MPDFSAFLVEAHDFKGRGVKQDMGVVAKWVERSWWGEAGLLAPRNSYRRATTEYGGTGVLSQVRRLSMRGNEELYDGVF